VLRAKDVDARHKAGHDGIRRGPGGQFPLPLGPKPL
jgi:hypothetical protein